MPGLSFSASTRVASGTLRTVLVDTTYRITYAVTDAAGASDVVDVHDGGHRACPTATSAASATRTTCPTAARAASAARTACSTAARAASAARTACSTATSGPPAPAPAPTAVARDARDGDRNRQSFPDVQVPIDIQFDAVTKSKTCSVTTNNEESKNANAALTAARDAGRIVPGGPLCDDRTAAHVDSIPGSTIHVCPVFFDQSVPVMSLTIMHEGLHLAGVNHQDFGVDTEHNDGGPMDAAIRSACGYGR